MDLRFDNNRCEGMNAMGVWNLCLVDCEIFCREFFDELLEKDFCGMYVSIKYRKELMKMIQKIRESQSQQQ